MCLFSGVTGSITPLVMEDKQHTKKRLSDSLWTSAASTNTDTVWPYCRSGMFWPSLSACTIDSLCIVATGSGLVEFSMRRNWSAVDSRLWLFLNSESMLSNYGQQNVVWAKWWRNVVTACSTSPFPKNLHPMDPTDPDAMLKGDGQRCIPRPHGEFSPMKRSPQSNFLLGSAQRPAQMHSQVFWRDECNRLHVFCLSL